MSAQNNLCLRFIQLKTAQEWTLNGEQLSFIFQKSGVGKWVAGQVAQRLEPGDVLVLNAALGGRLSVAGQGEIVFSCFSLQLEHLFPLFESSEICLLQNISDGFKVAKLYPAASPVALECHRRLVEIPAQINLDHRSHLLRTAAAILMAEFNRAKSQRVGFVRPEDHMVQVFEKLTAVEMLTLSVGELADKFGCSRRHLNRLFHHYFGISVAALRMEMRLLRSVTLLKDPDAKIIRVAEDCGFNHLGLFNICFKRRFGVSPGQWRKLNVESRGRPDHLHPDAGACPLHVNGLCPLSGNNRREADLGRFATLPAKKPGPARLLASAKIPNRTGKEERQTAAGHERIGEETQRPVVIRIDP